MSFFFFGLDDFSAVRAGSIFDVRMHLEHRREEGVVAWSNEAEAVKTVDARDPVYEASGRECNACRPSPIWINLAVSALVLDVSMFTNSYPKVLLGMRGCEVMKIRLWKFACQRSILFSCSLFMHFRP